MTTSEPTCPICKKRLGEHSEAQEQICRVILKKEFGSICPGFDLAPED